MKNILDFESYFVREVDNEGKILTVVSDQRMLLTRAKAKRLIESVKKYLRDFDDECIEHQNDRIMSQNTGCSITPVIEKKKKEGHVYLMEWDGLYKIGQARDCYTRLESLHHNNPKIKLLGYHESKDCLKDEKFHHFLFSSKREHGEWFRLSKDEVKIFLKGAFVVGVD